MDRLFASAKARHVLPTILVGSMIPYVLAALPLAFIPEAIGSKFTSAVLGILSYLTMLGLLWFGWCSKSTVVDVFGRMDSAFDPEKFLSLGVPMVGTGLFCIYLVYLPLSYVIPDFVAWRVIDKAELLVPASTANAWAINAGNVLMVVVAAPIVEELIFRGFLLGRFGKKYGMGVSLVITSILFALLHADALGSFLFAIMLCLIRIKHDSLIAPILVHAGNNAFVLILVATDLFLLKSEYSYTIEEFRSGWWQGLIGGAIGFPWLYRYYKRELAEIVWKVNYV